MILSVQLLSADLDPTVSLGSEEVLALPGDGGPRPLEEVDDGRATGAVRVELAKHPGEQQQQQGRREHRYCRPVDEKLLLQAGLSQ